MLKNALKFVDHDPDTDELQNVISSFLSTDRMSSLVIC